MTFSALLCCLQEAWTLASLQLTISLPNMNNSYFFSKQYWKQDHKYGRLGLVSLNRLQKKDLMVNTKFLFYFLPIERHRNTITFRTSKSSIKSSTESMIINTGSGNCVPQFPHFWFIPDGWCTPLHYPTEYRLDDLPAGWSSTAKTAKRPKVSGWLGDKTTLVTRSLGLTGCSELLPCWHLSRGSFWRQEIKTSPIPKPDSGATRPGTTWSSVPNEMACPGT